VNARATFRRGVPRTEGREYRRSVRFGVLGPLEVSGQDGPLSLGGPKQRIVLAPLVRRGFLIHRVEGWRREISDIP